jgi:hypothetical protein
MRSERRCHLHPRDRHDSLRVAARSRADRRGTIYEGKPRRAPSDRGVHASALEATLSPRVVAA